jgi:hypothetical protein
MNHLRHIKYALATALVASLATFGCSKDDSSSSSKGGAPSGDAKAAFSVFPKNTSLVLGLDFGHITGGDLYKKFKPMFESQIAEAGEELAKLKDKCGIDPFTDFKSAIVGAEMDEDMEPDEKTMLVIIKGPARSKLVECGKKMAEEDGPKFTEEGKFTKVEEEGEEAKWIGWMDDNTMAIAPKMDKATLEARLAGKDGMDGNKEMMDLLGNTDMSSGLWFAMAPKGGIKAPAGGMGMPAGNFKAAFGSVSVKSGLSVDFGMRTGSSDEASEMASQLKKQISQMKPMLGPAGKFADKLELDSKGADLIIAISLSVSDIEELMEIAGPMMGGF